MNKKLTLNIEEDLIRFAHKYAKRSKQSVSNIVETYLGALKNTKENQEDFNFRTKELYVIFEKVPLPEKEKNASRKITSVTDQET
jgi:ribosome recycling factor